MCTSCDWLVCMVPISTRALRKAWPSKGWSIVKVHCVPIELISFCFANKFVKFKNNSINICRSLEWSIVRFSWKFNRVLSIGSKVMRVQIWTTKFWTFQHVTETLLTKNYDVISVAKYQFLWIFEELFCECQVHLLDSICVLQQHKHFL